MTQKELEKLSDRLREDEVPHLLLARLRGGISLSSIATGNDMYEFLQVLVDMNDVILEIMQTVIDSRKKKRKPDIDELPN